MMLYLCSFRRLGDLVHNPFRPFGVKLERLTRRSTMRLNHRALACFGLAMSAVACAPTVRLEVAPIEIHARLDADVRVRLDRELQDLLAENPNLF